jgi:hypothetical protein
MRGGRSQTAACADVTFLRVTVPYGTSGEFAVLWDAERCRCSSALKPSRSLVEGVGMEASGVPIARWRLAATPGTSRQQDGDPITRARVLTMTERCWCCRSKIRAVVGVLVDMSAGRRFVPFTDVAETLASSADPRTLAARGIGPLRHRDSPGIPGGYISNGCLECDTLIGRLALDDMLDEHVRNGGTYAQLDCGLALELEIPASARWLQRVA